MGKKGQRSADDIFSLVTVFAENLDILGIVGSPKGIFTDMIVLKVAPTNHSGHIFRCGQRVSRRQEYSESFLMQCFLGKGGHGVF